MAVSAGDVLRVTAQLRAPDQQLVENVFHMLLNSGTVLTDADVLTDIGEAMEAVYAEFPALQASGVLYQQIFVHNVTTDVHVGDRLWPTFDTGTGSGEMLPPMDAGLVGFATGKVKTRGRKYFGPFLETQNGGGGVVGGLVTALAAAGAVMVDEFIGTETGEAWLFGVIDLLGDFWNFIEARPSGLFATQRRRRLGTGN